MPERKLSIPRVLVTETVSEELADFLKSRETKAFKPFPLDALPILFQNFAKEGAQAMVCDPAYFVPGLLAGASALIGNSRVIQLKEGWNEPAVVWIIQVAGSGTTKSPATDASIEPIFELQRQAFRTYENELASYAAKLASWESRQKGNNGPVADDPKPARPRLVRFYVGDTTIEALAVLLEMQPRGLLLFRDELSGWFTSFDKFKNSKGSDVAQWLEMHRAKQLIVDRKTGEKTTIFVPKAFVSVVGSIQPGVLAKTLTPEFLENGLAARFLFVSPPREKKVWTDDTLGSEAQQALQDGLRGLCELDMDQTSDGEYLPRVLTLSPAAKALFIEFYNQNAEEQQSLSGSLSAARSKLEAYAARLALIHHLVNHASGNTPQGSPLVVQASSMAAGIKMARWFGSEARRLYAGMDASASCTLDDKLVNLIRSKGGVVTANDLRRASRALKTNDDATAQLQHFVDRGFGTWQPRPSSPKGGAPTTAFHLAPQLRDIDPNKDVDDTDRPIPPAQEASP